MSTTAGGVGTAVLEVGPSEARALLARNAHNRHLRPTHVHALADAMRRGEWELNGESIKLAADGALLDGQHRLAAVVESGRTIATLVVTGLPVETQETMDTGRRRRLADLLTIRDVPYAHSTAATLTALHRFEATARFDASTTPTPAQALAMLEARPELETSVRLARRLTREIGGPTGVFAALHHVFRQRDADAADAFFANLMTGANLAPDDPILHLRRQVSRTRKDRSYAQRPNHVAALTIKAFNLWRARKRVEVLAYKGSGATPEAFPRIT